MRALLFMALGAILTLVFGWQIAVAFSIGGFIGAWKR